MLLRSPPAKADGDRRPSSSLAPAATACWARRSSAKVPAMPASSTINSCPARRLQRTWTARASARAPSMAGRIHAVRPQLMPPALEEGDPLGSFALHFLLCEPLGGVVGDDAEIRGQYLGCLGRRCETHHSAWAELGLPHGPHTSHRRRLAGPGRTDQDVHESGPTWRS